MNRASERTSGPGVGLLLGAILAAYACARILEVFHGGAPRLWIVSLDVLSAMAFALVDGARHYRLRGILVFAAICTVIGNITENLSVLTGFPFGRYYFAGLMGPKLFHVPVLLGLAYIGMAYVSWTLARAILGEPYGEVSGMRVLTIPLVASFIMVAWDLAQDPVWATVLHGWIWLDGGPWFGVPISNYLGWYGNIFAIYLLFAFFLRGRAAAPMAKPGSSLRPALLFYLLCAAGNVLQVLSRVSPAWVQDPTGRAWRFSEIAGASALVSIFVMGAFAAIAWARISGQEKEATG
jgi:putative membrane protein